MSKLADARCLNICLAWRELICLSMLSDSDLRPPAGREMGSHAKN